MAGWGATSEFGDSSCVLRDVEVSIMSNLDCVRGTSFSSGMITGNMMCAGYADGEEDSCQVKILTCLLSKRKIQKKIDFLLRIGIKSPKFQYQNHSIAG